MHLFWHKRGSLTAVVAAFVLVLQSSLTIWAAAVAPADPMLDSWGNPLCISSSMDQDGRYPANDHSRMLDCCTLGCGASSAALSTPLGASIVLLPPPARSDALRTAYKAAIVQIPDHDPGSPRAPPLMA